MSEETETPVSRFQKNLAAAEANPIPNEGEATKLEQAKAEEVETDPAKADADAIPESIITPKEEKPSPTPLEELEAMQPPKNYNADQIANFNKLREFSKTQLAKAFAERDELKSKVPTAPPVDVSKYEEQVKTVAEKLAETEAKLEKVAFEQSPRFQQFDAKEKQNIESAKSFLEGTEISKNIVDIAAGARGPARFKILREAGVDQDTIDAISPHLARVDDVRAERTATLDNRKVIQQQEEFQAKAANERAAALEKEREDRLFNEALTEVAEIIPAYKKDNGNPSWNERVDRDIAQARQMFNGSAPLKEIGKVVLSGIASQVTEKLNKALTERLNAANAQIAKLTAAAPSGGNLNGGKPTVAAEEKWTPQSAAARFNQHKQAVEGT